MPTTPVGKISKPALRADALVREVHRVVWEHAPGGAVRLDETGPRQRVVITVPDPGAAGVLRAALSGYPFEISLVVPPSRPAPPTPVPH
ncbi:hypothetical protein LWC33_06905 [Pseudonocardia sp. RS11V-5]|uniref:hypothetical protein n=1 Tax=Pseudonocardia terrae TaxID=2905831 RepID=UPI001E31B702|nr:hypothetical protein [Pseudonocardia terrae]MCE3551184.1 hypothetical protein [Pseudonocardia terrae]